MKSVQSKLLQNAATATGNGAEWNVAGLEKISLQITGITTATVSFEGSNDGGTTYAAIPFFNSAGSNASSATANGMFVTYLTGYSLLRARISAYTSGTIYVYGVGNG